MRQDESRAIADAWMRVADRMDAAAEARGERRSQRDLRGLGLRLSGSLSHADKIDTARRGISKADAEAELRAQKKAEAIAYDGPAMVRVQVASEQRRSDCARYAGCLDRFVARYCQRRDEHAQCPTDCAYFVRSNLLADARVASSLDVSRSAF